MVDIIANLQQKGFSLPDPLKPGGAYQPVRILKGIAYVSIQFPFLEGIMRYQGRLGAELSTREGYQAAQICSLNVLAQVHRYIGFENILGLNHLEIYLQTAAPWDEFPSVADGASLLFLDALGEVGIHSRSLFGVERLPVNAPVALVTTFTLKT
jgi:hypothetical protein